MNGSNEKNQESILVTIKELFGKHCFRVPQYQRSYAWEEKQIEAFVEDLRHQVSAQENAKREDAKKPYFLGTLLLHCESGRSVVNVVDGQQRMTTTVIFIAAAMQFYRDSNLDLPDITELKDLFVVDSVNGQKFRTVQNDNPFFSSAILGISAGSVAAESLSARRLLCAKNYFLSEVKQDEWTGMISALLGARVLAYVVDNLSTAAQIFEFQNDRGKPLSNLEVLKSFLMHNMHLHTPGSSETALDNIQTQFEAIYRDIEFLAGCHRSPDEDQILSYHCAAFCQWKDYEYSVPKQLVKKQIQALSKDGSEKIILWIESFVASLRESYRAVVDIYKTVDGRWDFAHLLVLGRLAPFWPLLIKAYVLDGNEKKERFFKACRLMEIFAFRAYGLANRRSDSGHSHLIWMAREFKGDYEWIYSELKRLSREWDIDKHIRLTLDSSNFYGNESHDALYILWRYENYLREGKNQHNQWAKIPWAEMVRPASHAEKLSIEHIAAQNGSMSSTLVSWNGEPEAEFREVALHRLGNLVLDSISSNSSKQDGDFEYKWKRFSESSTYLSQGELSRFVVNSTWDIDAIRNRHNHLVSFVITTWDPDSI